VRVLLDAGAEKEAKAMVSQRRGGMSSGQTFLFFAGGCIEAATCQCADEGRVELSRIRTLR